MDDHAALAAALSGRYEIDREIGRGGMATVYLARDLKHDRHVALKLLDPELGAVLGAERFLSEIRVTANLQHPNLLPLFDSGSAQGLLYYVMPYVEGESLRHRLDRERQLPVDEAVRIAVAIAGALDYAHQRGVIHRDLKPENILLQHGQPVVADFGIALAVSKAGGQRVTQTGLSLGTPQYMSPEQATGDRVIDGRTDVYSLGAMTYESLAGEPPHVGSTAQAIIARLMTETPRPLTTVRPSVPAHVDAAVRCALEKLPADRFATAKDFADALVGRGVSSGIQVTAARAHGSRAIGGRALGLVVAGSIALGVAAGVGGYAWRGVQDAPAESVRFTVEPPAGLAIPGGTRATPFALSPDGQVLVFAAGPRGSLALRRLDRLEVTTVTGVEFPSGMAFSGDGRWVAYRGPGGLFKVPLGGPEAGAAPTLVHSTNVLGPGLAWGRSADIVFIRNFTFWRVSASGGTPRMIASPDTANEFWSDPLIVDDGRTIAFRWSPRSSSGTTRAGRLGLVSIDGGERTVVDLELANVLGYVDGFLVYGRSDGRIMGVRIDLGSRKIRGEPVVLLENVATTLSASIAATLGANGTLAYQTGASTTKVEVVDQRGVTLSTLPVDPRQYVAVNWSPDGRRLLLRGVQSAGFDLWLYDTESRVTSRLTDGVSAQTSEWAPDGRIAFLGTAKNGFSAYWMPADGSGEPERVAPSAGRLGVFHLSRDGKYMIAFRPRGARGPDTATVTTNFDAIPLDGGTPIPLPLTGAKRPSVPIASPDGRWMAYASSESDRREVYVRPFPTGAGRVQVSSNGGDEPQWARDGRLFYETSNGLRAVTFDVSGAAPRIIRTDSLFATTDVNDYSVHPDGKRIVVLRDAGEGTKLVVVTNWWREARSKLKGT